MLELELEKGFETRDVGWEAASRCCPSTPYLGRLGT